MRYYEEELETLIKAGATLIGMVVAPVFTITATIIVNIFSHKNVSSLPHL